MENSTLQLHESFKKPATFSWDASAELSVIFIVAVVQFIWLGLFISTKIALINLFPSLVLITVWTLFISHYYASKPLLLVALVLPVLVVGLRLPIAWFHNMQVLNWLLCLTMVGIVVRHILPVFSTRREKLFLLFAAVILCMNTATHVGLNSPFTYTFRLMSGLHSAYARVDNNDTWECAYDQTTYPVHCDARHFVASEHIFTEPNYDPSQSVVLQRFLHGYLNSLSGLEGTRFWANLILNMTFWFFACALIYRICRVLKLDKEVAGISMLCCASAWGFVSMVAQPAPYMLSYAYALVVVWATLELIYNELDKRRTVLLITLIASIVMIYDAYQMILFSVFLLFFHRKRFAALSVFVLQFIFTAIWALFSMKMVLGTQGCVTCDSHSLSNIKLDVTTWLDIVKTFNFSQAFHYLSIGTQAYLYGNLIIGPIAAWAYIFGLNRPQSVTPEEKTFLLALVILNVLVLASAIFIVPQTYHWSPASGMQPRILFYSFPINMIALVLIAYRWLKKYTWSIPALLLVVANINLTGWVSIDMVFDYGLFRMFLEMNTDSVVDSYGPISTTQQSGMLRILDKVASFGHKVCFRLLPKTFISFLLVGSLGVVVHMFVLNAAMFWITSDFRYANGTAMLFAATFNYLLNNKSTFHKNTLSGRKIIAGYVIYLLITSVGLASSLAVSTWVFNRNYVPMVAALCGIVVGAVWNYLMSYTFVWKLLSKNLCIR